MHAMLCYAILQHQLLFLALALGQIERTDRQTALEVLINR